MFDTYMTPRPRTEYVTREVNITEKRAPTDESLKLLREMEKAADAKRFACMKIAGNTFNCHVEIWRDVSQGYMIFAGAVFDVNGKRCTAQASIMEPSDKAGLMQALHAEIAKVFAAEVLRDSVKGLRW